MQEKILLVLFLSILSGTTSFVGREGPDSCWYKTLIVARTGVTLCIMASIWILFGFSFWLLTLALVWGATTLGDFNKFYWSLQGLACALAFGFWAYGSQHMQLWVLQILIVTLLTYLWSRSWFGSVKFVGTFGRGFLYCASILLYLIRI